MMFATPSSKQSTVGRLSKGASVHVLGQEGSFYLLGLSPNAARIAVRLWKSGTIKEFKQNNKIWV